MTALQGSNRALIRFQYGFVIQEANHQNRKLIGSIS